MRTNFIELLKDKKVIIPIIQRDYAQGRDDNKIEKIRTSFLTKLFEALSNKLKDTDANPLELDFVYGTNAQTLSELNEFNPLDGQQRLTTLYLLHWYVAAREDMLPIVKNILKNFEYQTRHSAQLFCEKLVSFLPQFNGNNIADIIRDQEWYFLNWNNDATIKSMLVMLSAIETEYNKLNHNNIWTILDNKNMPFVFYKLDMDNLGLPDDLYIKMNSRGKALTEFEYFKSYFGEIIKTETLKSKFNNSIDQEWSEFIWNFVKKDKTQKDLSLFADDCFIKLLNFLTDCIAYKCGLPFFNIEESINEVKAIYKDEKNLKLLFDTLDTLTNLYKTNSTFWVVNFYYTSNNFDKTKVRLFQNSELDLCLRCVLDYDNAQQRNAFTIPDQLLFYASITHLLNSSPDFNTRIRIVRNLIANSENELRKEMLPSLLKEVEEIILNNDLTKLKDFKTTQIEEEIEKQKLLSTKPSLTTSLYELEDHVLLRGCLSIFDINETIESYCKPFISTFSEQELQLNSVGNAMLTFGDYSQKYGEQLINIGTEKNNIWRILLTAPGYNKESFKETKKVLKLFLNFLNNNQGIDTKTISNNFISSYELELEQMKDWRYYFIKYDEFRVGCNQGFYHWYGENNNQYEFYKMKEKQFNGAYYCPFLQVVKNKFTDKRIVLDDYRGLSIIFTDNDDAIKITNKSYGYLVENNNEENLSNSLLEKMIRNSLITRNGTLLISQNDGGIDLDNRIEIGKALITKILAL